MASTPPPLPSSSEDSDFDDDDFGCFKSSVPVKAASNTIKEQDCQNSVPENSIDVNENNESDSCIHDTETVERSDTAEQLTISKEESLPPEVFQTYQLDETGHSTLSQHQTTEEEVLNVSVECSDSNQFLSEDTRLESDSVINDNGKEEHSAVDEEQRTYVQSEDETDSIPGVVSKSCDYLSGDKSFELPQEEEKQSGVVEVVNYLPEPADPPSSKCEKEDLEDTTEDEFGDWSDITGKDSNETRHVTETVDLDESTNQLEEHNLDDTDDIIESKDDVPQDDTPDIPSTTTDTSNIDSHQNSFPAGDDDFGDFADFSSHQGVKNSFTEEKNIPPISFRTSSSDEKDKDDEDSNDMEMGVSSSAFKKAEDNVVEDDDDDDDDWGFKSAEADGNVQGNDDFGNFGSADDNENGEDWASFNESSVPAAGSEEIEDFSDFNSSDLQPPSYSQNDSTSSRIQDNSSKVEKVVFLCFPSLSPQLTQTLIHENDEYCDKPESKANGESSGIDDLYTVVGMGLKVTPKAKEETWTIVNEIRNKDPVVGTWGRLKDVNSSHALDYGWGSSHCCQEVFSTLHIDTQNVLFSQKKQAVPFYTSGLGILEPIRGGPNPAEKNQPPVQPTLLDTDKPEENKKVLDIPPVDFDWGSSGLTNPLKVFKTENFNTGLSSLEPFSSDVLQKSAEPSKELSKEAKSILSKIPSLNFMRSNVLMFPIKD